MLARAGLDLASFVREAHETLTRALPSDGQGFGTLDPTTVLPTGGCFLYGCLTPIHDITRWAELEYLDNEPTSLRQLVRDGVCASSAAVTRASGVESKRLRELFVADMGWSDELRILGMSGGRPWGSVDLVRLGSTFTAEEVQFGRSISADIGRGLRASILNRKSVEGVPVIPQNTVLLIDGSGAIAMSSPGATEWLAQVAYRAGDRIAADIVIASLVAAARHAPDGALASVQLRLGDGSWTILRARLMERAGAEQPGPPWVAITSTPSSGPEIESILSELFGLTSRERDVIRWIVQGADTRQTARELRMSRYTVQDHLKSIFAKVGVHSRRELAARMSAPYGGMEELSRR